MGGRRSLGPGVGGKAGVKPEPGAASAGMAAGWARGALS